MICPQLQPVVLTQQYHSLDEATSHDGSGWIKSGETSNWFCDVGRVFSCDAPTGMWSARCELPNSPSCPNRLDYPVIYTGKTQVQGDAWVRGGENLQHLTCPVNAWYESNIITQNCWMYPPGAPDLPSESLPRQY